MTFVRTKLLVEEMAPGETAEIRLGGGEPLENVPRSVREHGHEVLALHRDPSAPGVHVLRIRKRAPASLRAGSG